MNLRDEINLKKSVVTVILLIIGCLLITTHIQNPEYIFYGGVATSIIIDIAREFVE